MMDKIRMITGISLVPSRRSHKNEKEYPENFHGLLEKTLVPFFLPFIAQKDGNRILTI